MFVEYFRSKFCFFNSCIPLTSSLPPSSSLTKLIHSSFFTNLTQISMEITSKFKDIDTHHHSPLNSPSSHGSSTTSNGPIPITRSDPNSPYPTTFVTADTSSFKQVVQMLTGSPKPKPDSKQPDSNPTQQQQHQNHHQAQQHSYVIPPVKTTSTKPGFKLYERRNSSLKHMMINPLTPNYPPNYPTNYPSNQSFSPRNHSNYHHFNHINGGNNNNNNYPLSPSLLDFPSLTLSPVTPLVIDTFDKSSSPSITSQMTSSSSVEEEEKAIAEKGFYLHPSPRDSSPKLLPLFPLSSPRVSDP